MGKAEEDVWKVRSLSVAEEEENEDGAFVASLIVSYFFTFLLFWAPCLVVGAKKYIFVALYKNSDGWRTGGFVGKFAGFRLRMDSLEGGRR